MAADWKSFLQRWFVTTLGVLLAAAVIDGVRADTLVALLATSLLLGILNAFLRPVLLLLTFPLLIATLGLFTLVINALLLYLVASVVKGFHVDGFWAAFKASLLISVVSFFSSMLLGTKEVRIRRTTNIPNRPTKDTGSGPVIDV